MSTAPADRARELYRAGRFDEALAALDAAIALSPPRAEFWNNRGTILAALQRLDEACASFEHALSLNANFSGALANRANILLALGRYEEAGHAFERVLAGLDLPYARGNLLHSRLQCCDWRDFAAERARLAADVRMGRRAASPLAITALFDTDESQHRAAHILSADKYPPRAPLWRGETFTHDRVRVAYVSADFAAHATATLMAGVFERHDRARFEAIAISLGPNDGSAMRARLERAFDRFIDTADLRDVEIATLIRELEIDIAVDLKGYTSNARPGMFGFRPAPVQASYLGYPGTMAADFIDYTIADRWVIPEAAEPYYSEKIVRLPNSYQANNSARAIDATAPSRAEVGLPEAGFVFCCFNNSYKILPDVFDVWMRILRAVDGSALWLLQDNPAAIRNLRRETQSRGVDGSRLVFAPRVAPDKHLARHRLADLFLDTLPYNAHTTASDALWAGVPILTCIGNTFAGRVAASLLHAVGLPELITNSIDDYRELALRLAHDPDLLAGMKAKLAQSRNTCSLFDTAGFTRDLEAAFTNMHERRCRGLPPATFVVD